MKPHLLFSALFIASVIGAKADELSPYDRLNRKNVTINARSVTGGSSTQNSFKTDYGSYDKTKSQAKSIEVTIKPITRLKADITVEFCFVFRDAATKAEFIVPCQPTVFKEGTGVQVFSEQAVSTDLRLVTIGIREKTGESIYGWLVRATRGNKIVGVAGSAERLVGIAGDPKLFDKLVLNEPDQPASTP